MNKNPPKPNKYSPVVGCSISDILRLLDSLRIPVTLDLYLSFIQECTQTRDPVQAIELHNHIRISSLRPSLPIFNRLLLMYASCQCIDYAEKLFERMSVRSVNSWAAMISGYFENGDFGEVVNMFVEMRSCNRTKSECVDMENIAFCVIVVCGLKACAKTMNLDVGKQIHGWIMKIGYSQNLVLSSSLMSFYGKVGCIEDSNFVFNQVRDQNNGIWTAKIISCCKEEQYDEAIKVFRDMGKEGVKKNSFTFSSILKACAKMEDSGCCGQQVHAGVIKAGLELNEYVQCGLVDMYGKCGLVKEARKVHKIYGHERNISCWNAMLTGYIQQGLGIEALKFLYEMKAAGLQPQESLLHEVRFICGSS